MWAVRVTATVICFIRRAPCKRTARFLQVSNASQERKTGDFWDESRYKTWSHMLNQEPPILSANSLSTARTSRQRIDPVLGAIFQEDIFTFLKALCGSCLYTYEESARIPDLSFVLFHLQWPPTFVATDWKALAVLAVGSLQDRGSEERAQLFPGSIVPPLALRERSRSSLWVRV